jgi:hypothetical protein
MHSYMKDETFKEETKYIPTENGLIYTPMILKSNEIDDIQNTEEEEEIDDKKY